MRYISIVLFTIVVFLFGNLTPSLAQHTSKSELEIKLAEQQSKIEELQTQINQFQITTDEAEVRQIYYKILLLRRDIRSKLVWKISENVQRYSKKYKQDPDLVIALIRIESHFDPSAVSSAGAIGLMQVMPMHRKFKKENLFDIETNIDRGLEVYTNYLEMYDNNRALALLAYNMGEKIVNRRLKRGGDPSNGYEIAVLRRIKQLKRYQSPFMLAEQPIIDLLASK